MKIVQLTAENIKRLKAIDITPAEHLQVITGRNAQGKTSVLDAIWLALGGGDAKKSTPQPVRDGTDHAEVTLTLGQNLLVTRTWTADGKTSLKVTNTDGAKYTSPQGMLDDLVGRLSFDPLAFAQLAPREQRDALLSLVELPFDPADLDAQRKDLFDTRTGVNREAKELAAQLTRIPEPPAGTPQEEVSAADLLEVISDVERANAEREGISRQVERYAVLVQQLEQQLADARRTLAEHQLDLDNSPPVVDTAPLRQQVRDAGQVNTAVRAGKELARVSEQLAAKRARADRLTQYLAELDAIKVEGLAAAAFPVAGLGFDDDGVTYNGTPFVQASGAERIRVSLAMAMALNPRLRVIRILDGSLLDRDNLQLIEGMAVEHDYQVWVERVEDASAAAVVIEDGQVLR